MAQHCPTRRTDLYSEVRGNGDPVLLIHGGGASFDSFYNQITALESEFRLILADSRGHGRSRDTEAPLTYESMAADYESLLCQLNVGPVSVIGWSDGGVIGLELARRNPRLVTRLVTIGTAFHIEGLTEEFLAWIRGAGPEDMPPVLRELYANLSPDGAEHWPVLFEKLRRLWLSAPTYTAEELTRVQVSTLVMFGDRDVVKPAHMIEFFRHLPRGQLAVVPGATHFLPIEKPALVNQILLEFLRIPIETEHSGSFTEGSSLGC